MRRICVITFARSEYSACFPILQAITSLADVRVHLVAAGAHLSPEHGYTVREIQADGFTIDDRLEMLLSSDSPQGIAKSIGLGTIGLAGILPRCLPDIILIIGDRLELLTVACAALPFRIPIAHVSGGDITEGSVDNQVRNAVSKLSSLHFVAMQEHADRLLQMGEEPWRVFVTGDPALDVIADMELFSRAELQDRLNSMLDPPVLVVTFHPATLGEAPADHEIDALLMALTEVDGTLIFTAPNQDMERNVIIERIQAFVDMRASARLFSSLGRKTYYSLLTHADAMVGNSSSGIWEAPSFQLPVVNVGDRQRGRRRASNVIDVAHDATSIVSAIRRALAPSFRESLRGLANPYGDGMAAPRIAEVLKDIELGPRLLRKSFADRPWKRGRSENGDG